MKDFSKLAEYLGRIPEKVIPKVIKAQKDTAKIIQQDIKSLAPFDTGQYEDSIKVYPTEVTRDKISTEIATEEVVVTKDGNVYNLGMLLETGTDPHAIPNAFGWGDIYGYESEMYKRTLEDNWHPGTIAQPHFKPGLEKNEGTYKENIRKAIKEAEKE